MKKFFGIVTVLVTMLSPLAEASKARFSAIGQDVNGSLFIEDARNVCSSDM